MLYRVAQLSAQPTSTPRRHILRPWPPSRRSIPYFYPLLAKSRLQPIYSQLEEAF
jgi:hypothetical protein